MLFFSEKKMSFRSAFNNITSKVSVCNVLSSVRIVGFTVSLIRNCSCFFLIFGATEFTNSMAVFSLALCGMVILNQDARMRTLTLRALALLINSIFPKSSASKTNG